VLAFDGREWRVTVERWIERGKTATEVAVVCLCCVLDRADSRARGRVHEVSTCDCALHSFFLQSISAQQCGHIPPTNTRLVQRGDDRPWPYFSVPYARHISTVAYGQSQHTALCIMYCCPHYVRTPHTSLTPRGVKS